MQLFACENTALIVKLNQFFASSSPDVLEKLPPELIGEWTDFFEEAIYNLMLPMPISITGVYVCVCVLFLEVLMHLLWETNLLRFTMKIPHFICTC